MKMMYWSMLCGVIRCCMGIIRRKKSSKRFQSERKNMWSCTLMC